jgi:predicted dehydrogenase
MPPWAAPFIEPYTCIHLFTNPPSHLFAFPLRLRQHAAADLSAQHSSILYSLILSFFTRRFAMHITFHGHVVDEPRIRAGFIGCGSHSFRNIYPTFQFAPVNLVATCDRQPGKAEAFAAQFGADRAYTDHRPMLEELELDAVFIVTGYDAQGRPTYPKLAQDCLAAGCHVWIEKPPAATTAEIAQLQEAADKAGKQVMVGLKKMFFPANEKAKALMDREDFGTLSLAMLQYPQYVPTVEEFRAYRSGERSPAVGVLDHLCHPASLLLYLMGMPDALSYARSSGGAGVATFTYTDGPFAGAVASLAFTHGAPNNRGMERTTLISNRGRRILVENNIRLFYDRMVGLGYGDEPNYYQGDPEAVSTVWEPEFSLGQLYNKGLFLLGYYGEVNEFARAVLEHRPIAKGTLTHARQVTRIFEAFAEGAGRTISLTR